MEKFNLKLQKWVQDIQEIVTGTRPAHFSFSKFFLRTIKFHYIKTSAVPVASFVGLIRIGFFKLWIFSILSIRDEHKLLVVL